MLDGWLLFMAEAPLIGIDPMPAFSPNTGAPMTKGDANEWFTIYNALPTLAEAMEEVRDFWDPEDNEEESAAPDFPLPVRVHDDGRLEIFDTNRSSLIATYTPEDIFKAFGLTPPKKDTP